MSEQYACTSPSLFFRQLWQVLDKSGEDAVSAIAVLTGSSASVGLARINRVGFISGGPGEETSNPRGIVGVCADGSLKIWSFEPSGIGELHAVYCDTTDPTSESIENSRCSGHRIGTSVDQLALTSNSMMSCSASGEVILWQIPSTVPIV